MTEAARRWATIFGAVAIFCIAFARLYAWGAAPPVAMDSVRDLMRVRDCAAAASACDHLEIPAHAGGLVHGMLWMRFLIATTRLGLTPSGQGVLLVISFSLAAAVIYWWVASAYSGLLAPLSAVYFLTFVPLENVLLTNTSLALLPAAVFHMGLSRIAGGDRRRWVVITGLALYACVEANASCLVLAPVFFAITIVSAVRPLVAAGDAFASVALPALLFSRTAWATNMSAGGGVGVPFAGATVALAAIGVALRPVWLRIPAAHRQRIVPIGCVVAFMAAAWVMVQWKGWVFNRRYLAVVLPAIAALPACIFSAARDVILQRLTRAGSRWGTHGTVFDLSAHSRSALALLVAILPTVIGWGLVVPVDGQAAQPPGSVVSFEETEVLANALKARGWSYYQLQQVLHGPNVLGAMGFLVGLSYYMEPQSAPPPMSLATHLRIFRVDQSQLDSVAMSGWDPIDLPGRRVALISSIPGWVRARPAKLFVGGTPWPEPGDQGHSVDRVMDVPPPNEIFEPGQLAGIAPPSASSIWIDLPVEVGDDAEQHVVNVLGRSWSVHDVMGVAHDDIPPDATSVVLRSGESRRGTIRFASRGGGGPPGWVGPLEFMETLPQEDQIRAQLLQ